MGPRGSQRGCFQTEMFKECMSRFPGNHPLLSLRGSRFRISQVKTSLFLLVTEPGSWASRPSAVKNRRQSMRYQRPLRHLHSVSPRPLLMEGVYAPRRPPAQLSTAWNPTSLIKMKPKVVSRSLDLKRFPSWYIILLTHCIIQKTKYPSSAHRKCKRKRK